MAATKRVGGVKGGVITYGIQVRGIKKYYKDGSQIHGCRKGKWVDWMPYSDPVASLFDAILEVNGRLQREHQGFIVVRRHFRDGALTLTYDKLYDAKWGTDDRPFYRYSPLAEKMLGILAPTH